MHKGCVLILLLYACASPAQLYERRGMYGLALEYLLTDAKTLEDGSRARVIAAIQRVSRNDRDEALARGATRQALGANLALVEQDGKDPDATAAHARLKRAASDQENTKLDQMTERGAIHVADLGVCRRAQALGGNDDLKARCASMRQRLQVHATLNVSGPPNIAAAITNSCRADAHDLFDVVQVADLNRNAALSVSVSPPSIDLDTDFVEVEKRGRHVMVPTGKKEKVTVQPTKEEIEAAKRDKKPAPQPHTEEKALYREETGEYRLYRRVVIVAVPWSYALHREKGASVTTSGAGVREERAVSEYYEYTGSDAARDNPRGWPEGRKNARPVPTRKQMRDAAEAAIASSIVSAVAAHTEQE